MSGAGPLSGLQVLVTGASGFIGSHLVDALLARGASVTALTRRAPTGAVSHPGPPAIRWVEADPADVDALRAALADARPQCLFHLSSLADGRPARDLVLPILRAEVLATVNVLALSSELRVPRIVLPGSMETPAPGQIPASPYAAAKAASQLYAQMFHQRFGLPVVVARIFMAYGPRQPAFKLIPSTLASIARGEPPIVRSAARAVDWIHVSDVVEGLLAMLRAPGIEGRTIDLGSGRLVEVGELVRLLCELAGSGLAPALEASDRGDERVAAADLAPAADLLGWTPRVGLREGLARTIEAFRREQLAH